MTTESGSGDIWQQRQWRVSPTKTLTPENNTNQRQTQLVHDEETNTYLNYRQLMQHPKYKEKCSKSSANEFGRLANGLKDGRVKPTNTIRFIQ
jgi:hypothetical protein